MSGLWTIESLYSWLKLLFKVNTKSAPLWDQAVLLSGFVAAVIALEMGEGRALPSVIGVYRERCDKCTGRGSI